MLTLYYVAATWLHSWRLSSTLARIKEIRKKNGSIALHQEIPPYVYMVRSASAESRMEVNGVLSKSCSNHNMSNIKDLLWYSSNRKILSIYPQQELDVSTWISVIPGRTQLPIQLQGSCKGCLSADRLLLLLEADYHAVQYPSHTSKLQIEEYGVVLAWHVKENMSLLLETDEKKLAALCVAFMHHSLALENGIQIVRVISVKAQGLPYKIKNSESVPETYVPLSLSGDISEPEKKERFLSWWRAHISMMATFSEAVEQVSQTMEEISVRHPGAGIGAVRLVPSCIVQEEDSDEESLVGSIETPGEGGTGTLSSLPTHNTTNPTALCGASTPSSLLDDTLSRISTDTVIPPDSSRVSGEFSLPSTPLRSTISTSLSGTPTKPPNILVYSDSSSAGDAIRAALLTTLNEKYTVDKVSWSNLLDKRLDARLLVVHGDVPSSTPLIRRLISTPSTAAFVLCSDLLRSVLPMFRTAEVRPNELVRCSYKNWKHVPLVHHIFMYQPSPPAKAFSQDDHSKLETVLPNWVDMVDEDGDRHRLKLEVLGTEETWRTPSLLQVTFSDSNSKILFSQVHLELDPRGSEETERLVQLKQSDRARLEILCDLLSNHLSLEASMVSSSPVSFSPAYFLGNHERKQMLLSELADRGHLQESTVSLDCGNGLSLKFCGKGVTPPPASASVLPILLHSCPHNFSTVQYFEELKSDFVGRLVIFSPVLTSSMDLVRGPPLHHGLAVIPLRQTHGSGRGNNSWLSPLGCGMFTLQLHVPLSSFLGSHLSLLQHLAGLAVVSAICQIPGLQELNIGLKWPNDIYANRSVKLGGIISTSSVTTNVAICNIGCGVNVFNKEPTVCLNDLITSHCKVTSGQVPPLTLERYFALVFNKLEELYDLVQSGRVQEFFRLYYDFWLHTDAEVTVKDDSGSEQLVTIKGIDEFGFLSAVTPNGQPVTLHPDGNSFDMMSGLIISKTA